MRPVLGLLIALPLADGQVRTSAAPTLAPDERAELSITITEGVQRDMPLEVRLSAADVELADNRLGWEDVVDPGAELPRVRARITAPSQPGAYAVEGLVMYVTCGESHCRPRFAEVAWTVTVTR